MNKKQTLELHLGGEPILVHISAMKRKSLRLGFNALGEVELRIPLGLRKAQVLAFVREHQDWLLQKRKALREVKEKPLESVIFQGKTLPIKESALGKFLPTDSHIWVPSHWSDAERLAAFEAFLIAQGKLVFPLMIERWWGHFAHLGKPRPKLRVKKMRSRWGSLSSLGYINLNRALMQLPEHLMELVVVHELCHLAHFDHGPGFKAMMQDCLSDWQEREKELKAFAPKLL